MSRTNHWTISRIKRATSYKNKKGDHEPQRIVEKHHDRGWKKHSMGLDLGREELSVIFLFGGR
jgi:hypothetical protein